MSKMIQLRNVPDELHRKLKARAASAGMTLSDFLIRESRRAVERVTDEELLARFEAQPVQHLKLSPTRIVREERDRRSR
jgi:antitoxin FitA